MSTENTVHMDPFSKMFIQVSHLVFCSHLPICRGQQRWSALLEWCGALLDERSHRLETIHTSLLNCFKHSVVEFIWHDGLTLNRIKGAAVQLCTSLFHTFSKFRIRIAGAHAHATSFRCVWRQRLQEAALDGAFSAESWLGESHGTWGWTWTKMASGELMQRP